MPDVPGSADDGEQSASPGEVEFVLGTVPYLNVQPNIWALKKRLLKTSHRVTVVPDVPRKLAERLARGEFDCAIVPVFEYFRRPEAYAYIPGPVIAARGAVASVLMLSSVPWREVRTVYLDPSSLTSVHLFKVLAAEYGLKVEYRDATSEAVPSPLPKDTGWVLIGDPALGESGKHAYTTDLAVVWRELTGLSFVFAAWLCRRDLKKNGLAPLLQKSLEMGLANLPAVADDSACPFNVSPEFALHYFRENIHYHLGDEELAGWYEFGRLCFKHGLISQLPVLRAHVEQQTIN